MVLFPQANHIMMGLLTVPHYHNCLDYIYYWFMVHVVVHLPRHYGRKWGDSNFQMLTELPVPPQAGVIVTFEYIYYRFIVRFPIGLDFLFITFTILLHLLLSWTSSLSISSSAISTSTLFNHVFLCLPTGLLP